MLGNNESLEGSDGPDILVGDNGDNSLMGHLGADILIGKGGNDFIDAIDGQRDKKIDCGGGERRSDQGLQRTRSRSAAELSRCALVRVSPPSPEARLADQRHEAAGADRAALETLAAAAQKVTSIARHRGDRDDQPAALGELVEQGRRRSGAAAWTAIASNGARSGTPRLPSPTSSSTSSIPSAASARAGAARKARRGARR